MKFNSKIRYGLRAMVEIAKADAQNKVYQKDISKTQKISPKYLDQIIQSLKSAGLITQVKGRKNGYRLTRDASKINVLQIHTAFEPEVAVIECLSEYIQCDMEDICTTKNFWTGLNTIIIEYLGNVTVQDLANGNNNKFTPHLAF